MKASVPRFSVTTAIILACCASPAPPPTLGLAPSVSSVPAPGSPSRDSTVPAPSSSSTASSPTANVDDERSTTTPQPEQEAELEQRVAAFGPAPTLCEKAIRCCEVASPLLSPGGPCDIAMQMGSPPRPDHCLGYLRGNRMLFDIQKKKLPRVCL